MQIHAGSKVKVLLDGMRMMPTGVRSVMEIPFCFHSITHYVSEGWYFSVILWHRPHSCVIFDPHTITAFCAHHLNLSASVTQIWRGASDDPTQTNRGIASLDPKSIGFDRLSRTRLLLCQFSSHCNQGFRFTVLRTHIHKHIVTEWSLYPRRSTTSTEWIFRF